MTFANMLDLRIIFETSLKLLKVTEITFQIFAKATNSESKLLA